MVPSRSRRAREAEQDLYNSDILMYVEGKDDILFWEYRMKNNDFDLKVKKVGGKEEIKKYIDNIIDDDAKFLVGSDSDFLDLTGNKKVSNKIFYTYGHSIENSMYCKQKIADSCRRYLRVSRVDIESIGEWIDGLKDSLRELVAYEVANELGGFGKCVMGDSCIRFAVNRLNHIICCGKVTDRINALKSEICVNLVEEAEEMIGSYSKEFRFLIKGHFLETMVQSFIINYTKDNSETQKKPTISSDSLYSEFVTLCNGCTDECDERIYYSNLKANMIADFQSGQFN